MDADTTHRQATVRQLRQEIDMVDGAIALVASGAASRVRLGVLTFGEPLIERARRAADRAGVRVTPVWTASDGGGIDLVVERGDDAGS